MKKQEKVDWIDQTLGSLGGASRAQPPADLFEKAMLRSQKPAGKVVKLPTAQLRAAAVGLVLLVSVNVLAAFVFSKNRFSKNNPEKMLAREYFDFANTPEF